MAQSITWVPASVFGLPSDPAGSTTSCWTIDKTSQAAGGADNGFLDCARAHTPGFYSDGSTAEAVANLLKCGRLVISGKASQSEEATCKAKKPLAGFDEAGTSTGNIVGHGNDGLIVTGQGQSPSDPAKFITTWNESNWGPEVLKLKGHFSIIKLWACHPGTGQEGADLLYALMLETNCICMGPTGFLFCGGSGFYLEANSTWQVAVPGQPKPNPIQAPTPHFVRARQDFLLEQGRVWQMTSISSVTSVVIMRGAITLLSLRDATAQHFLGLVDLGSPFEIEGVLGAIATGHLIVGYNDAQGTPQKKEFVIYNNRLLQSLDNPNLYYRCSEGFGKALVIGVQ